MRCFPQLETGAAAQYPLLRVRRRRTVRNRMADGRSVKLADDGAAFTEWRLEFRELTDGELAALAAFFEESGGRLGTFTFLDPGANLLCWSEDPARSVWEKSPLALVSGGGADPWGGTRAWRIGNGSAMQTLNVPRSFTYCLSLHARSEEGGTVRLWQGGEQAERVVSAEWKRLTFTAQPGGGESVRFGVERASGAVEVFGLQVEAQAGASGYKRTASRGGVYANARFAEDTLLWTTEGPGRHGCTLGIIHGERF